MGHLTKTKETREECLINDLLNNLTISNYTPEQGCNYGITP